MSSGRGLRFKLDPGILGARQQAKDYLSGPNLQHRFPLDVHVSAYVVVSGSPNGVHLKTRTVTMHGADDSIVEDFMEGIEEMILVRLDPEKPHYEVKDLSLNIDEHRVSGRVCPVPSCKKLQSASNFSRHVRRCSKNTYCKSCDSFITDVPMGVHLLSCRGQRLPCSFCGQEFVNPSEKRAHERRCVVAGQAGAGDQVIKCSFHLRHFFF